MAKTLSQKSPIVSGWRRLRGCLKLQVIFLAREPLTIGLFCETWPMKLRHTMTLRHPVLDYFLCVLKAPSINLTLNSPYISATEFQQIRTICLQKSSTYLQASPFHRETSHAYLQKSPKHPQKSPIYPRKSPVHLQKSPEYLHKSPIYPQKNPVDPQKRPECLQQSPAEKASSSANNWVNQSHISANEP